MHEPLGVPDVDSTVISVGEVLSAVTDRQVLTGVGGEGVA